MPHQPLSSVGIILIYENRVQTLSEPVDFGEVLVAMANVNDESNNNELSTQEEVYNKVKKIDHMHLSFDMFI